MNPLDIMIKFFFNNIFFFLLMGFIGFFFLTYLKFGKKIKYKIIDRDEVERQKFMEAMIFNKTSKFTELYRGEELVFNGGENIINKGKRIWHKLSKIGNIEAYLEFEQKPIKLIEKEGKVTYEEEKNETAMKLIAMVVRKNLFLFIPNPLAKPQPILIENDEKLISKDEKGKRIIIPEGLGFDKFMGYYYMIGESTKPKLRNILDARILTTDFTMMASRYFAKSQEQCVYAPELAFQMAQKQTELNIELAKRKGIQQTT